LHPQFDPLILRFAFSVPGSRPRELETRRRPCRSRADQNPNPNFLLLRPPPVAVYMDAKDILGLPKTPFASSQEKKSRPPKEPQRKPDGVSREVPPFFTLRFLVAAACLRC